VSDSSIDLLRGDEWSNRSSRRPIMRLSHARSKYIYDLYYKRELISRELYDWLLKQKYADAE
jgi:hypothetical protein